MALKSTFLPPTTTRIIERNRLLDVLSEHGNCRLTWVCGNAAQGKSTLLATFITRLTHPVVWINLGHAESDTVQFYKILIEALKPALSPEDLDYLISMPVVAAGTGPSHELHFHLVRPLLSRMPETMSIVLDDFDQMGSFASCHCLVRELIFSAPESVHWIILSREKPPFSIDNLRLRQKALLITNEALAFSIEEIEKFFRFFCDIKLTSEQCRSVANATEGWAGGLILLAQSLVQIPGQQRIQYLERSIGRHLFMGLSDYFQEVIVETLPEDGRRLLMHAALLPELLPDVLHELMGDTDLQEILQTLCDRNLFVTETYDAHHGVVFRLHNLLRIFLKECWQRSFDEGTRRAFLRQAARVSEKRGHVQQALDIWFMSGDLDSCAALLAGEGLGLWLDGCHSLLQKHLNNIPGEVIEDSPWLMLYKALAARHEDHVKCYRGLERALTAFESQADIRGTLVTLAALLETTVISGHSPLPLLQLVEKSEKYLFQHIPDTRAYPFEESCLWNQIAMFRASRGGPAEKRRKACINALLVARQTGHHMLQFQAHSGSALACTLSCDFVQAREHLNVLDSLVADHPYPQLQCLLDGIRSIYFYYTGEVAEQTAFLRHFKQTIRHNNLYYYEPLYTCQEILLTIAIYDYKKTIALAGDLIEAAENTDNVFIKGMATFHIGAARYGLKHYAQACSSLQEALNIFLSPLVASVEHAHLTQLYLGFVLPHLGKEEAAAEALRQTGHYYQETGNIRLGMYVHLAKALLAHRQRLDRDASRRFHQAFSQMSADNFLRPIIITPDDMATAACLALDYGLEDTFSTIVKVLAELPYQCLPKLYTTLRLHKKKSVRNAVTAVDRIHNRASRPLLEIKTLGYFSVAKCNCPDTISWDRPIARKLLKILLCHDGEVGVEPLMEEMWPEAPEVKQRQNFKVTLHRLRKILEPDIHKEYGSSYLQLQKDTLCLDVSLSRVDSDLFESCCGEAEKALRHGNVDMARDHYHQALNLYKGDFLENDLHEEWAMPKRRRLRNRWHLATHKLADLLAGNRQLEEALEIYEKLREADPLDETIYRSIMRINAQLARPQEIHRSYQRCERALLREIDCQPSAETTILYRNLLHMKN